MNSENFVFKTIPSQDLKDDELNKVVDFLQRRSKEIEPRDPLPDPELRRQNLLQVRQFEDFKRFYVFTENQTKVIGYGVTGKWNEKAPQYEDNKHRCFGGVQVDENYRKKGIGSRLLSMIFQQALDWGKASIDFYCIEESGHEFYNHVKIGNTAQSGVESRVYFEDMKWDLMNEWNSIGDNLKEEVEIMTFVDVPDEILEEFCKAYTIMENLVPKGEQEWEALITPDYRRDFEERNRKKGTMYLTKITREQNGEISGLTEIEYNPKEGFLASQELTAVIPKYRGRGLGKFLKANMAIHLRDNYPEILFIQTGNADENAPMLSINTRMGFKPHRKWVSYILKSDDMKKFIDKYPIKF